MKLLLENWRKLLEEGDVVDLPTGATVADRYASYVRHLDMALEELQSISDIFEIKGHTVEDIEIMIQKLGWLKDDPDFEQDVESLL